jgi:hypothetical protein
MNFLNLWQEAGNALRKSYEGVLNLWQEARGKVLRTRYDGIMSRMDTADPIAKSACLGVLRSNFEFLSGRYAKGSSADRKQVLEHASKIMNQLSDEGDWPRALGLTIIMFNLQARDLPGDDAAVVKAATDALIKEANDPLKKGGLKGDIEGASPAEDGMRLHARPADMACAPVH